MINYFVKLLNILPGVSIVFSKGVFIPKLYFGALSIEHFSGSYVPGAELN